ncbi:MAG TPA: hypothetical protein P5287_05485 [bacterium]|nr:hypothetical protein [bacterium]
MFDIVLPLLVSVACFRSYAGSALICLAMLFLKMKNMTMMMDQRAAALLGILAIMFIILAVIERSIRHIGRSRNIFMFMMALLIQIIRFPLNFVYAQDVIFRLRCWGPLPAGAAQGDQPSIGAAVGGMLDFPLGLLVILSGIVIAVQLRQWIHGEDRGNLFS